MRCSMFQHRPAETPALYCSYIGLRQYSRAPRSGDRVKTDLQRFVAGAIRRRDPAGITPLTLGAEGSADIASSGTSRRQLRSTRHERIRAGLLRLPTGRRHILH